MSSAIEDPPLASGATRVRHCRTCLMPNTRPRIGFDHEGICNACRNAEAKARVDWRARRAEFLDYLARYRGRGGNYDCIVPWSGGKDSTSIALRLKQEFGLRPLLVTFSPLLPNEVGAANRETLLNMGFDHLMVRPDQNVSRRLARRFLIERGNPKVHWDAGRQCRAASGRGELSHSPGVLRRAWRRASMAAACSRRSTRRYAISPRSSSIR